MMIGLAISTVPISVSRKPAAEGAIIAATKSEARYASRTASKASTSSQTRGKP